MKLKTVGYIAYYTKIDKTNFFESSRITFCDLKMKAHRTDGPAIMWEDGWLEWRKRGLLHRTDGPALIYMSPSFYEYWINGIETTKEEIEKKR